MQVQLKLPIRFPEPHEAAEYYKELIANAYSASSDITSISITVENTSLLLIVVLTVPEGKTFQDYSKLADKISPDSWRLHCKDAELIDISSAELVDCC